MAIRGIKQLLAEANAAIETVSVDQAISDAGSPDVLFVDIRESQERQSTGGLPRSIHVPRGFLEFQADPESPMHVPELSSGKRLILYCASGGRSALAAKTLVDMGIGKVSHMAGGIGAWIKAGGPVEPAA